MSPWPLSLLLNNFSSSFHSITSFLYFLLLLLSRPLHLLHNNFPSTSSHYNSLFFYFSLLLLSPHPFTFSPTTPLLPLILLSLSSIFFSLLLSPDSFTVSPTVPLLPLILFSFSSTFLSYYSPFQTFIFPPNNSSSSSHSISSFINAFFLLVSFHLLTFSPTIPLPPPLIPFPLSLFSSLITFPSPLYLHPKQFLLSSPLPPVLPLSPSHPLKHRISRHQRAVNLTQNPAINPTVSSASKTAGSYGRAAREHGKTNTKPTTQVHEGSAGVSVPAAVGNGRVVEGRVVKRDGWGSKGCEWDGSGRKGVGGKGCEGDA